MRVLLAARKKVMLHILGMVSVLNQNRLISIGEACGI